MSNICKDLPQGVSDSSSLEDYLEAILALSGTVGAPVRITDLSDRLGVSKPSASVAVKRLTDAGLVLHERYGDIRLTPTGRKCAKRVAGRHELLFRFLKDVLGVDASIADEDACRLEHDLSPQTVECLMHLVEFLTGGSEEQSPWNRRFNEYLALGKHHGDLVGDG
jgi:DtxR family transcriptional regulator, Mn-dependent transcriptional regulator